MEPRQRYTTSQSFRIGHNHPQSGVTADRSPIRTGAGALNDFTGRTVALGNSNSVYPRENRRMRGRHHASQRDIEIRPFEQNSSPISGGRTVHASLSSPSDSSLPYFPPPENNTGHPSFRHPSRHTMHEVESMDTGRGRPKRKRFGNSLGYERGSTNRYENGRNSSIGLHHYRGSNLSIHNEDPSRNVRRRNRLDWEVNPSRDVRSWEVSPRRTYSRNNISRSRPEEVAGLNGDAVQERFHIPGSSGLRPEVNQNSARGSAANFTGHIHDSNSNRNSFHGLRAAHSESYSSRYSLSVHQDPSFRTPVGRVESLSNVVNVHEQTDAIRVNPLRFYVPREYYDENGDFRFNIEDMSYEELLSLGERIGNVRTGGLSKNAISKCLVKTTYSTLDDNKKEGPCVICQEDYSDMEEVATIKDCGHDYHTGCIVQWLSIKNTCPICQGLVLPTSPSED